MRRRRPGTALLVVAHGERRGGAANHGIRRLVARLTAAGIADEIGFGLLSGSPSIAAGLNRLCARDVLIYPLFLANGFFAATRLPQAVAAASRGAARTIRILAPLGLDPALDDLVAERAAGLAQKRGETPSAATLVLLAHGSTRDPASHAAAQQMALRLARRRQFRDVRIAVLEGGPSVDQTLAAVDDPVLMVGMFSGEGLHAGEDVPALLAAHDGRVGFAGNIGAWPEVADLVAAAVARH